VIWGDFRNSKPQRTRNSLEALLRRTASGLPRVNRLTDLYNAVSVLHQVPLGGEDLTVCWRTMQRSTKETDMRIHPFHAVTGDCPRCRP
jgi:hypothetical protein